MENIYCIGNAHLDPVWLWRWQEGCAEVLQTFRSAVERLGEYDDFVFTCSSAAYYRWVEELDPELFEKIRALVKEGRWVPVGGWWVQPDCNLPSNESFARQGLYSQLYYYEKFGKICTVGYNVDSFGHSAMLPQFLTKAGMHTYVFQRPNTSENPDLPTDLFWWDSADGSRVLTYRLPAGYTASGTEDLDDAYRLCSDRAAADGHGMMLFYGVGNHGGGPTKGDIEYIRAKLHDEGWADAKFSSPDEFFEEQLQRELHLPAHKGDLQHHASGCYSVTSRVKALNRKAENLLTAAEKFDTVASYVTGSKPQTAALGEAWKKVCFNQFHDILCGCAIREAYDDVAASEGSAIFTAEEIYNAALLRLSSLVDTWVDGVSDPVRHTRHDDGGNFPRPVIVFNPHSCEARLPVRVSHPSETVTDADGNEVLFQNVRASRSNDDHLDTLFAAKVPPLGYATYWLTRDRLTAATPTLEENQNLFMENEFLSAEIDGESGLLISLVDKATGFDYAANGPLCVPTVIDDKKTDTWAHNVFKFHDLKGLMEPVGVERVENGRLRSLVRTRHRFGDSTLTQEFSLTAGQRVLRVDCKVFWREPNTLLKLSLPVGGKTPVVTYEVPGGFLKKSANGLEEPALNWADLTVTADGERRGIAVMTDSKYSYDCPGAELRLTALRNKIFADHYSYRPAADFDYTDEGLQRFSYGLYPHAGEAETTDVTREAHLFNNELAVVTAGYHKGPLPQTGSYMTTNADNVLITAVKRCEDGSGDLIIRLYETKGRKNTKCYLMSPLFDNGFWYDIAAHENKTFRVAKDGKVLETDFLEGIVRAEPHKD